MRASPNPALNAHRGLMQSSLLNESVILVKAGIQGDVGGAWELGTNSFSPPDRVRGKL